MVLTIFKRYCTHVHAWMEKNDDDLKVVNINDEQDLSYTTMR